MMTSDSVEDTPVKEFVRTRSGRRRAKDEEAREASSAAAVQTAKDAAKAAENAVTARLTKTKMCFFFDQGKCASTNCRYAHSSAELRHAPNLHKTKLCKTWLNTGFCNDAENCLYAHGDSELRVTEGIYKTQMCHFFERGRCLKGDRCNHAHGKQDLRGLRGPRDEAEGRSPDRALPASLAPTPSKSSSLPLSQLIASGLSPCAALPFHPSPIVAAAAAAASTSMFMEHYGGMTWPLTSSPTVPGQHWQQACPMPMQSYASPLGFPSTYAREFAADLLPCDLSKRLASLDSAVQDLKAERSERSERVKQVHRI